MKVRVGTLVALRMPLLGNHTGSVGVCYEEYDLGEGPGGSFIFENGNYDGFSPKEQDRFLTYLGDDDLSYRFENVIQVGRDFRDGIFSQSIDRARALRDGKK